MAQFKNPVPWNPANATLAEAQSCIEFTRELFQLLGEGRTDGTIAHHARQTMELWQRQNRNQSAQVSA